MTKKRISLIVCIVLLLLNIAFLRPTEDGYVNLAKINYNNKALNKIQTNTQSSEKPSENKPKKNTVEAIPTPQQLSIQEIVDFYASQNEPERSKSYLTIAHRFLDISEKKVDESVYEFLDKVVIGETKVQLERSEYYQKFLRGNFSDRTDEIATATAILKTMDQLFRKQEQYNTDRVMLIDPDLISPENIDRDSKNIGFTYKENLFYDTGLSSRQMDCDNMVVNYLAAADVMKLPLFYVPAIRHAYIAWELSDGTYLCFETTNGHIYPENKYITTEYHIELKEMGYFFNPISEEQTISEAYIVRAHGYLEEKNYFNALRDYCKAIQINPDNMLAYFGVANAFRKLSYGDESQLFYEQARKMGLDLFKKAADEQR